MLHFRGIGYQVCWTSVCPRGQRDIAKKKNSLICDWKPRANLMCPTTFCPRAAEGFVTVQIKSLSYYRECMNRKGLIWCFDWKNIAPRLSLDLFCTASWRKIKNQNAMRSSSSRQSPAVLYARFPLNWDKEMQSNQSYRGRLQRKWPNQ